MEYAWESSSWIGILAAVVSTITSDTNSIQAWIASVFRLSSSSIGDAKYTSHDRLMAINWILEGRLFHVQGPFFQDIFIFHTD